MPQTHDVGNSFVHFQPHPRGGKTVTVAETYEVEEPYRVAKSVAIRLWPLRLTVVFGRWDPATALWDEEDPEINERLMKAMGGTYSAPWLPPPPLEEVEV